jgi:hypothetical protein
MAEAGGVAGLPGPDSEDGKGPTRFSRILIARCAVADRFSASFRVPSRHLQHSTPAARPPGPNGPDR